MPQTLEQFVDSRNFASRNCFFDRALYSLNEDIARICCVLSDAGIPFEFVGSVAVLAHNLDRDRSRGFVPR
jgi:hypothetical protein